MKTIIIVGPVVRSNCNYLAQLLPGLTCTLEVVSVVLITNLAVRRCIFILSLEITARLHGMSGEGVTTGIYVMYVSTTTDMELIMTSQTD